MLRRGAKWLLCSGLAAVALVLAVGTSLPLWAGPLIARQAASVLGRAVTIGHMHLSLLPFFEVVAQDVVIGNPEGFNAESEPFVRVAGLKVQIDAVASLRRQALIIRSIEMDRPVIRAVETEEGQANYHLPLRSGVPIGSLSLRGGRARISLAPLHADFEVTFTSRQAVGNAEATAIAGEARGTYAGAPLAAQFSVSPPSEPHVTRQLWPIEMTVQNGPTQASLKGSLQSPSRLHGAVLDVSIAGPDMLSLRQLTGVPFPATPPYELRGRLDITQDAYQITGATGRLGRSEVEGTMTIATRPEQPPEISADVGSQSVNLRDIVSLLSGKPGPPGTPGQTPKQQDQAMQAERQARANPRVLSPARLHPAKLDRVNVHLNFRAQHIQGASMPLDNLAFGLDLVNGEAALHQLRFGVGQGQIAADIRLSPHADDELEARADIRFERVDVGHLLWASGGYQGAGALNGVVHMQGAGRSLADIFAGADGAVSLWMEGGDLSSLLVDLAGLRLGSALFASLVASRTTEVGCFLADLALQRGILSTRTLLLETEDAVTQGTGIVDLRQERIEVRLWTQSRHITIGVLPAPLLINGTLKEPRAAPDPLTPAGRGGLAGALSALPVIQLGMGKTPPCNKLLREAQNR